MAMYRRQIVITHYRKKCIGCGVCASIAPHTWEMDDEDGKANLFEGIPNREVVNARITADVLKDNTEAADQCPEGIIQISQ